MSWVPPPSTEPEHRDWKIEDDGDWRYVGTTSPGGTPILLNGRTNSLHRGHAQAGAERLAPADEPSWELEHGESLGQLLERVGQETGWESLSEFACDHLRDEDAED